MSGKTENVVCRAPLMQFYSREFRGKEFFNSHSRCHLSTRSWSAIAGFVKTSRFFFSVFLAPPPQQSRDDDKPLDVASHHKEKPRSRHFRSAGCRQCEAKKSESRSR